MNISMKFMRGLPRLLTVCLLGMFVALIAVSSVQSEGSAQAANKVVWRVHPEGRKRCRSGRHYRR